LGPPRFLLSRFTRFTGGFRWLIRAWRWIGGSGMHRIGRAARIHRDNRRSLSVSAAGVVRVITAVLRGLVLPDRQDQGRRTRRRRRPAQLRTGSPGCGRAALNPWADPKLDRIRAGQSQT
jgi:hypothetical protein